MAGAYCQFCGHRCFVYREIREAGRVEWSGHMATCREGAEHDRVVLGADFRSAHNPYRGLA